MIAIGRFAEKAATELDLPCTYVRHPAQGGLGAFREVMQRLYR